MLLTETEDNAKLSETVQETESRPVPNLVLKTDLFSQQLRSLPPYAGIELAYANSCTGAATRPGEGIDERRVTLLYRFLMLPEKVEFAASVSGLPTAQI